MTMCNYRRLSIAMTVAALSFSSSSLAQTGRSVVEEYFSAKDPPSGSLIFQQRDSLEGRALGLATGSTYTHVGIIRITGGGPYVMQSSAETGGVEEVSLDEFINIGVNQKFAIYVTKKDYRPAGQLNSPASLAAYDYYHLPYDFFYKQDSRAIYSAELIFKIFKDIGHPIGRLRRIGDLNFDTEAGRKFLLNNWHERRDCQSERLSQQACWDRIKMELVITPNDLADDRKLELYMTTF